MTQMEAAFTKITENATDEMKEAIMANTEKNGARYVGKIVSLNERGFGFIISKDIKFTKIFFHWTALKQNTTNFADLKKGATVEFAIREVPDKGKQAVQIEVVKDSETKSEVN